MPQFRYRAVTKAGEIILGEIDAPSREEVIRRIEYVGQMPIEAELASKALLDRLSALGDSGLSPRDLTVFLRQLGLLVGAGLTLEATLQTLGENSHKATARFAETLRSAISAGDSFAEALQRHPTIIGPAYVAMIRVGEASGKLDGVLEAIVEDRARNELLLERINSAVRYPAFLIGSAVLILFFFLIYVVPQFEPVFKDLGGKLNGGAAFVLAASTWLRDNLDLFLGGCLAAILGIWFIFRSRERRAQIVGLIAQIPGIATPMNDRRTVRIVRMLGLLVTNGVPLPDALKILRDIVVEPRYVAAIDNLHEQVRKGRRFSEALADSDILPPLALRMLRVGDETGDLAAVANHAAHFYEHKLGIGLDRLMGAIGPITIIFVSVVVGALIMSIMTALLSITDLAS
jgi:general secretion pathway protein F